MIEMPHLSDEVRAGLPPEAQAYIGALEALVSRQDTQISEMHAQMQTLQTQMTELQARIGQTSQNSSRPPSSDPPQAPPRPQRPVSGRKRGGQPGHERHARQLLPASEVDAVIEHRALVCPECQAVLAADLPDVGEAERQQVWDLPEVQPHVTEHRYHRVTCPHCGAAVEAERPADVPAGAFGARVVALVGLLHGRYRLSVREIVALLLDIYHLPISPGAISDLCQVLSQALAAPYSESQTAASTAEHANVDETGWKQAGRRRWLWVMVSVASTVFLVATQRSAKALKRLLGEAFQGIVTSDRFKAYLAWPVERRQICWAHLKRNWVAFSELPDPLAAWGQQALAQITDLFALWQRFQNGELDRPALQAAMQPVQAQLRQLLEQGQALPFHKVQAFCRDLLHLWPALWTFLAVAGVEPTNNAAERALRPAVLWRKGCFGTQSERGDLFVARILTIVTTCRQQDRHVLTFLTDSVRAYWASQPAPALCHTP
jgi:transposase